MEKSSLDYQLYLHLNSMRAKCKSVITGSPAEKAATVSYSIPDLDTWLKGTLPADYKFGGATMASVNVSEGFKTELGGLFESYLSVTRIPVDDLVVFMGRLLRRIAELMDSAITNMNGFGAYVSPEDFAGHISVRLPRQLEDSFIIKPPSKRDEAITQISLPNPGSVATSGIRRTAMMFHYSGTNMGKSYWEYEASQKARPSDPLAAMFTGRWLYCSRSDWEASTIGDTPEAQAAKTLHEYVAGLERPRKQELLVQFKFLGIWFAVVPVYSIEGWPNQGPESFSFLGLWLSPLSKVMAQRSSTGKEGFSRWFSQYMSRPIVSSGLFLPMGIEPGAVTIPVEPPLESVLKRGPFSLLEYQSRSALDFSGILAVSAALATGDATKLPLNCPEDIKDGVLRALTWTRATTGLYGEMPITEWEVQGNGK